VRKEEERQRIYRCQYGPVFMEIRSGFQKDCVPFPAIVLHEISVDNK